jgi:hypothetical protein
VYESSFFSTSSPTFGGGVLDGSYSNRSEVGSWCGFDSHSFLTRDGEQFLMCSSAIWTSFEKVLFSSVTHFFIGSLIFGELIF